MRARSFFFEKRDDIIAFANKQGWKFENNGFSFGGQHDMEVDMKTTLDSKSMVEQNMFYAKQLEMIV